jgi:uncharacterized ferritin-like protein (DUF455 family)
MHSAELSPARDVLPVDRWARRLAGIRQVLLNAADRTCLWLIEEPELSGKSRLASLVWDLNWCADALAGRLLQLRLDEPALDRAEAHPDDNALLAPLTAAHHDRPAWLEDVFVPALARRIGDLRTFCDPLLDAGTEDCLEQIQVRLGQPPRRPAAGSEGPGAGYPADPAFTALPPLNVPERLSPARPAGHPPLAGYEWPSWRENLPEFLHAVALGIEVCAAEVCAQAVVRHPEMPAGLRFDLARQISDEMRHAQMLLNRAAELGVAPLSVPYDVEVWDQLQPARTLLDRLTLEQRIGEGNGLDDSAYTRDQLLEQGDARTAAVFDFITADELIHVRSGNHWIRALLGGSQSRVDAQELSARARAEAAGQPVREIPPYLNVTLRRLAGFTEQELLRMTERVGRPA